VGRPNCGMRSRERVCGLGRLAPSASRTARDHEPYTRHGADLDEVASVQHGPSLRQRQTLVRLHRSTTRSHSRDVGPSASVNWGPSARARGAEMLSLPRFRAPPTPRLASSRAPLRFVVPDDPATPTTREAANRPFVLAGVNATHGERRLLALVKLRSAPDRRLPRPLWHRVGQPRREHHGVLPAVQRADRSQFAGQVIPVDMTSTRTVRSRRHEAAPARAHQAGPAWRKARRAEPEQGRHAHSGPGAPDRGAEMVDLNANDVEDGHADHRRHRQVMGVEVVA